MERLGLELEKNLDRDTCYVADVDSGKTMDPLMAFGGNDKQYFGTGPNVLGWGMAAAFGVKLARPDVPVVSVVGDGSFCFSGPQPLWSMARYKAPITVIVLNNHSYNNERNRIWNGAGRQFEAALDMTCYNGDPDVDYAKAAGAFGVDGETVKEPGALKGAFARARAATVEGRPYLLDIHIKREGLGAVSRMASALFDRRHAHAEGVIMRVLALVLALAFIAAASPSRAQQNANPLPQGDGRELVAVACSQCHYLGTIAKIRDGAAGWRTLRQQHGAARRAIEPVRSRQGCGLSGAQSRPGDRSAARKAGCIAGWPRQTIGGDALRIVPRSRTGRHGQAQQQAWAPIVASMIAWGAPATPEEAKTMTDYLAVNFGD